VQDAGQVALVRPAGAVEDAPDRRPVVQPAGHPLAEWAGRIGGPDRWQDGPVTTPPEPGRGTAVEERTDERTRELPDLRPEPGDSERFSHYVPKGKLMEALVNGTPVRALCGKVWTPSRDPKRFPVCPECKEIWESLPPGDDGDPDR
jgi:hypothetical protein